MNKELREKIARLKTALAELEERVEALPNRVNSRVFKPEDGEEYWIISDTGGTFDSQWVDWVDTRTDEGRYAIGNCFSTRKSAEDAVRVLKLIQKARESQDGFVPDWENREQRKFYLYFNDNGTWTGSSFLVNVTPTFGYWGDKSECDEFAKDNHADLVWFFTEYRR